MGILPDSFFFNPDVGDGGLLGLLTMAQRWQPVNDAVASGQFDPQGGNNIPNAPFAGIPMPRPRPEDAPQVPPNAMPVQGPIPPQFEQPPQQPPMTMPPAQGPGFMDRMAAGGAGFFNAGSPMEAIGNLIGGAVTGQRQDLRGMAQEQMRAAQIAAVQYVAGAKDIDPQMKVAMIQNPNLAVKYVSEMAKAPEYKFEKNDQTNYAFNPRTAELRTLGVAPKFEKLEPNQTGAYVTPPMVGRPGTVSVVQQGVPKFDDVSGLRKEITALPEVKRLTEAMPVFRSMTRSHKVNTSAADLDFVYGVAKIFDPDSVVREGEMKLVGKAQSLPEDVKGFIQSVAMGKARLTPEARNRILEVAHIRMNELQDATNQRLEPYSGIAERNRINIKDIIPQFQSLPDVPISEATRAQALSEARDAIRQGVPRAEVERRLRQNRIDPKGL